LLSILKKQLSKSTQYTHSARNLGFIYDDHLSFSDQILALSMSCYSHIITLIELILKQPVPPQPLSFYKLDDQQY